MERVVASIVKSERKSLEFLSLESKAAQQGVSSLGCQWKIVALLKP